MLLDRPPRAAAGRPARLRVRVSTPVRLHLGIFPLPDGGFGGLGAALMGPGAVVEARPGTDLSARGPQAERALAAAEAVRQHYGVTDGAAVHVVRAIPAHVGLGSGTQLDLAAATAAACLWGLGATPRQLAGVVGRGERTQIGIEAFVRGGLLLYRAGSDPPVARLPFPAAWRFVVVIPGGQRGLSGAEERRAFDALPPMPAAAVRAIGRAIEDELIPGLRAGRVADAGRALETVQTLVGEYFAPVQGGRYRHPRAEELARAMREAGARAVGQSSWGPALFALAESPLAAGRILHAALEALAQVPGGEHRAFIAPVARAGGSVRRAPG